MRIRIATVNVNGIRAAFRKGMAHWLESCQVDVVLAQEVRADTQTTKDLFGPGWQVITNPSALKGRAGVLIAIRQNKEWKLDNFQPDQVPIQVPADSGRWLEADLVPNQPKFPCLRLISVYLHSGEKDTEKQVFKMSHLTRVSTRLDQLQNPTHPDYQPLTLIAGDFNIVHSPLDIRNWKPNHNKRAGVLDEEIAFLDQWMGPAANDLEAGALVKSSAQTDQAQTKPQTKGQESNTAGSPSKTPWVDTVRQLLPNQPGPYSWWSWRGKAFDNDAGWRIDYQMSSPQLAKLATRTWVDRAEDYASRFSDHAPVIVEYELR